MAISQASRPIDRPLLSLIIGLSVFGAIVLLSASGPISFHAYSDPLYFVRRQILLGILPGIAAFYFFSRIDAKILERLAIPAFIATICLLVSVFIPGIGHAVGGSRSWIRLAGIQFQPSEFAKFTFLIYVSAWLASRGSRSKMTLENAVSYFGALGLVVILLVLEPDTGTMAVIAGTSMLLYSRQARRSFTVRDGERRIRDALPGVREPGAAPPRGFTFIHPELDPQGSVPHQPGDSRRRQRRTVRPWVRAIPSEIFYLPRHRAIPYSPFLPKSSASRPSCSSSP